jgi:hypothetical protein
MGILRSDRVSGLGGANAINGSVFFSGGQNLRTPNTADLRFGSSDLTVECWWHSGDLSTDINFVSLWNSSSNRRSWGLYWDADTNTLYMNGSSDGTNSDMSQSVSWTPSASTWYHIAATKIGTTIALYVDGSSLVSSAKSGTYYENTDDPIVIGGQMAGTNYDSKILRGSMSNLRIIKGEGIYTAAFTPPTNRLEKTANTVLLCCQSPGDITQEATGKDLVPYRKTINDEFPKASHIAPDVGEDHGTTFEDNIKFDTLSYMVPPGGTTAESNRGRALIMGGGSSPGSNNQTAIQYFNIQSLGTAQYFGALTVARRALQSVGSSTRGVALGGIVHPTVLDTIDYVTFATQSNAIDFGNLTSSGYAAASASNNTRGIWAGGYRPNNSAVVNSIDYITIATTGNAADFGDLTAPQRAISGGSNTTRAVFGGGAYPAVVDTIAYVTIASTGNATDFGNLTDARDYAAAGSSPTRTCFAGGRDPSNTNIIDYITTASTGNAIDFGDTIITGQRGVIMSNSSRGVIGSDGSISNALDYITFTTTGNSLDFGDQASSGEAPVVYSFGGCSDSHGGIS